MHLRLTGLNRRFYLLNERPICADACYSLHRRAKICTYRALTESHNGCTDRSQPLVLAPLSRCNARSSIAKAAAGKDKPEKPYEVRAESPLGLLLRVQPSGPRTFYVQVGRGQRVRIGPAGVFTLKQAEERAKKILLDPDAARSKARSGRDARRVHRRPLHRTRAGAAQERRAVGRAGQGDMEAAAGKRIAEITASRRSTSCATSG